MSRNARISHFHGSKHQKKYNHVKRLDENEENRQRKFEETERCILESQKLAPRIAQLGLNRWRDEVKAGLYQYVTGGAMGDTVQHLERFEKMERLSLLELAVWKYSTVDGVLFRTTDEIREQQALDKTFNASAYMQEQRVASGCQVIVPCVAKFL
ncbi:MAG: hypothetical protein SGARI_008342 [Bacillariaceae sp.]